MQNHTNQNQTADFIDLGQVAKFKVKSDWNQWDVPIRELGQVVTL